MQIGKESPVTGIVVHVPGGVDVNQPADPGHDQQHDDGELVHLQREVRAKSAGGDPREVGLRPGNLIRREGHKFARQFERREERQRRRGKRHACNDAFRPAAAKNAVSGGAKERQQRQDPEIVEHGHQCLSESTRSTLSVPRLRAMTIMMASPTAASAAATTMTKKTNTCPCNCPRARLNATNARFTALSISSMDMKMVMMLRLKITATTPSPNKTALNTR